MKGDLKLHSHTCQKYEKLAEMLSERVQFLSERVKFLSERVNFLSESYGPKSFCPKLENADVFNVNVCSFGAGQNKIRCCEHAIAPVLISKTLHYTLMTFYIGLRLGLGNIHSIKCH